MVLSINSIAVPSTGTKSTGTIFTRSGFTGTVLIEVGADNPVEGVKSFQFKSPFKNSISRSLGLADDLSLLNVAIRSESTNSFRVLLQLETSMTVMDEGAHLDLTDWKHCTTDWLEVAKLSGNKFALPDFRRINTDCFPDVSDTEIKEEVFAQGGERWARVLDISYPDYPEYSSTTVELSSVRLKVETLRNGKWSLVTVLDFNVPLGC